MADDPRIYELLVEINGTVGKTEGAVEGIQTDVSEIKTAQGKLETRVGKNEVNIARFSTAAALIGGAIGYGASFIKKIPW